MAKIFYYVILSVCSLAVVLTYLANRRYKKQIEDYQVQLEKATDARSKVILDQFVELNGNYFTFNSKAISPKKVLISEYGKEITIAALIEERGRLIIFNFSERNCDICAENELKKIKKLLNTENPIKTKILVLAKYANPRHLSIFKNVHELNYEIYNTKEEELLGSLNKPFYFVLDSDFIYKDFFIPAKEMPDITGKYFDSMYQKYFY